ncbi:hypothetical protein GBA52_027558 [Prunus armeniaca]|nr:hypothetical protein GBA52_027558 [Prunus armeniaca]
MATSLLSHLSAPPSPAIDNYQGRQAGAFNSGIPNTFLHGTKVFSATPSSSRRLAAQRRFKSAYAKASEHIPKQFRQENLKDGLMDNYKNVPHYLYGLSPSQMDMFMTEDNPARRQSEKVTEIVPAVTELLVAQFMWLDYDNPSKPIYLYINSSGTQNEKMESVGSETEAYAIADMMSYVKSDVYTVNCGMAYGQAALLLSLGTRGYRAVQPNSSTKLYLPKVSRSSGSAKELDANTEYYIELLAKGTGKTKEEIAKDIQRPKYFQGQEAIEYGLVDKIIDSRDAAFEKRNYDEMLTQSRAMRRAGAGGPQAAPSGFR